MAKLLVNHPGFSVSLNEDGTICSHLEPTNNDGNGFLTVGQCPSI